jgi:hypothetical protein
MLFKLRYGQGVNTDRRTQEVLIQDGKIEVAVNDYLKDYGRTPVIWTERPVNFSAILVEFFATEFPGLHIALSRFMLDIIELEKIYDWQTAVLPLALQFHEELADDRIKTKPSCTAGEQKERNSASDWISMGEIEPAVIAFAAACLARSSSSIGSRASILLVSIR